MLWIDSDGIECIFQIDTDHLAIGPCNIPNTLKGLNFEVFIFMMFVELLQIPNHSQRPILSPSDRCKQ